MIKKIKEENPFPDVGPRIARWLLCQKIGVVFFNSELPVDRLEQIKDYFERSDFLREEIFEPKLK